MSKCITKKNNQLISNTWDFLKKVPSATADFIKKVLSVYTYSLTTIYLSLSTQVAKSTFFMKSPIPVCTRDR